MCVFYGFCGVVFEDTMALRGLKPFICHYGGSWIVKRLSTKGEKLFSLIMLMVMNFVTWTLLRI